MLIGNEAKVTPYPLVEAKAIKKLRQCYFGFQSEA